MLLIFADNNAQVISGRFGSSVYLLERIENPDTSEKYILANQLLQLNISHSKIALRTFFNYESDFSGNMEDGSRVRFYSLYLEGRNIYDLISFKLGRQSVYNGAGGGLFDGISLSAEEYGFKLSGYFGGNVPAYQKLEMTKDFSDNSIYGGKLSYSFPMMPELFAAVGYHQKNFKPLEYIASRLSSDLMNPIQVLIRNNSSQFEFITGELFYNKENLLNINTKYEYDVNYETTSKFEADASYEGFCGWTINGYYLMREPKVRYNSIFSVFDFGNTQEIEGGIDYRFSDGMSLGARFANVTYSDENSQRLAVHYNSKYGSLSYRKTFGYAGELDAVSLYSAYTLLDGVLTPSVGLSITSYKLSSSGDKNSLVTILGGVNYRPSRAFSFDLQGQYLNNKIYKNDMRVFLRFNHWFSTNVGAW